jgi:anti-anti-sigma factor
MTDHQALNPLTVADRFGTVIIAIPCYIRPGSPGDDGVSGHKRDCLIVVIDGEVDLDTAPPVQDALLRALDGRDSVCCDLSRVTFFGAAGARAVFAAVRYASERGRTFGVRGAHGMTRRVLTVTDPDGLIDWRG